MNRMSDPDQVLFARGLLLQPMLRTAARWLPADGLAALRAELAALRDRAARAGTAQGAAMAEACATALADLDGASR
jgi:DNA-binding GntR family transcriptional regulator